MRGNDIRRLPIEPAHCEIVVTLPFFHRDPSDRLLLAQVKNWRMTILTADSQFDAYYFPIRWRTIVESSGRR